MLVAGMMMMCYGLVRPASGFLIPQLEDPEIGFGIDKDQGSWLGTKIANLAIWQPSDRQKNYYCAMLQKSTKKYNLRQKSAKKYNFWKLPQRLGIKTFFGYFFSNWERAPEKGLQKSDREKRATVKTSEVEVADYTKPLNEYVDYLSVSSGLPIIQRAHICH